MDISYLLFLQDIRNGIHDAWTPFLEGISLFSITYLLFLPTFIYWCINKKNGLYILCAFYLSVAVNAIVKLSVCAYRPWIRDVRIIPAGDAIRTATSYSFPSGHVMAAAPIYGGVAIGFWAKKTTRWISVLCIAALLITGFSRNYLGVHTPQDVLVGFILGGLILWFTGWIFNDVVQHPDQENKFLLAGILFAALSLIYITYKPYPLDYVNGKPLVDPLVMQNDAYLWMGALSSFCAARYVEKRWIRFTATGLTVKGIFLGIIGLAGLKWLAPYLQPMLVTQLGAHWGRFISQAIVVFYIVALYPLVLKWAGHKH